MKERIVVIAIVFILVCALACSLLLSGCSKQESFVGSWRLTAWNYADDGTGGMSDEIRTNATIWPETFLELKDDQTATLSTKDKTITGTWRYEGGYIISLTLGKDKTEAKLNGEALTVYFVNEFTGDWLRFEK